jgi:hypothetical protein
MQLCVAPFHRSSVDIVCKIEMRHKPTNMACTPACAHVLVSRFTDAYGDGVGFQIVGWMGNTIGGWSVGVRGILSRIDLTPPLPPFCIPL